MTRQARNRSATDNEWGWPLVPPPPAHSREPEVTVEDPTGGGYYCGARRSRGQLAQAVESGDPNPWPWCRARAGRGTETVGIGACKYHGGSTPNHRAAAQLRLEELRAPAIAVAARLLSSPDTPSAVLARVYADILDRTGHPRQIEVDVEREKETIYERLRQMQQTDAEN